MAKYYKIVAQSDKVAELWLFGFIGNSLWDDINPKGIINELKTYGDLDEIHAYINSEGGSVIAGNVIYNTLKNHAAKVFIHIEGVAASMASVIAMSGDTIVMAENALMMIHDPWTYADGNASRLRKIADTLDKAKATMIASYASKSGLSEDEISSLMSAETWMTASEALELGFIDQIGEAVDMAACTKDMDFTNFKNPPLGLITNPSGNTDKSKKEPTMPDKKGKASVTTDKTKTPETQGSTTTTIDTPAGNNGGGDIVTQASVDSAVALALQAENKRKTDISTVFAPFGQAYSELERACLMDGNISADAARQQLLAKIGESNEPLGFEPRVKVVEDRRDRQLVGFSGAILARVGFATDDTKNNFRGYSLQEMARLCLEARGVNTSRMDRLELVGAAFTHSSGDFTTLLQNVASKAMLKGWDEAPETFQEWTSKGTLSDFKPASRVDLNSFPALQTVPEGAEYKYATIGERGETTQLATYGNLFSITRQAIINDDLQAFTKIPMKMGRAALRTIGNLVYAILTGNPNMGDGVALFHADHRNLGSAAAIATAPIDALRVLMATQHDGAAAAASGNVNSLGITPGFCLVPEALKGAATVVMESETEIAASQNNSKKPNSVRNIAKVISDARLDAASATAYYLVANPAMFDTIEVSYLDGIESPYMEQQQGWNVDGTQFKVRIDAAVKALDFRTMSKNAGA